MSTKLLPELPWHGGCQCGAVRYVISALPLTLYACHCTECQRQSSASFGLSMPVPREAFQLERGEPAVWERRAASGRTVTCAFCRHCGTRIYHAPQRNPAIVNVKPGTLDEAGWIRPVAHLWTASRQAGVRLPDDVLTFAGQPADFEPVYAAWRRVTGASA